MKRIKSYEQFTNEGQSSSITQMRDNLTKDQRAEIIKEILAQESNKDLEKDLKSKSDSELLDMYDACCSSKIDEGFKDFIKKAVGQLKEWKLDGSYLNKASEDAKKYLKSHPASKVIVDSLKKNGLDQSKAEEAALHCYDSDIRSLKGYKIDFNKETNTLSLNLPKGTLNPSIGSI